MNLPKIIVAIALLFCNLLQTSISDDNRDRDSPDNEVSLVDVDDYDLEQEIRRRWTGGPVTPEVAVSILNMALDLMTRSDLQPRRARRYEIEARQLIQILTAEDDPRMDVAPVSRSELDDHDYLDDSFEVGASYHTPSDRSLKLVLDMVDGANGQRRRSLESIANLYPWFHPRMVSRIRARFEDSGTRAARLKALDEEVLKIFTQARDKRQPVHGRMIQRWARQCSAAHNLDEFRASDNWLARFKKRHKIVSRKVTAYSSRSDQENAAAIVQRIENFGPKYIEESSQFEKRHIYNFDQTGFNYEPANLRTLSFKGERDTIIVIDSKNKHSHSYTVQPMISRAGTLFKKLLIVTQEPENAFGPIVGPRILELERKYENIQIYPSRSGKLTSFLVDRWFNSTLSIAVDDARHEMMDDDENRSAILVLADSWSGHAKQTQEDELRQMGVTLMRIPKQTTDRLQPLDVNFNRQLKIFYNRIVEEAFYQDILPNVTTREGIINIHSLLHNQISSPKYRDMILYAWRNTDPAFNRTELSNFPPKMVNAIQFDFDGASECEIQGCNQHAFVRCSHCDKLMCLQHFLNRTCIHN